MNVAPGPSMAAEFAFPGIVSSSSIRALARNGLLVCRQGFTPLTAPDVQIVVLRRDSSGWSEVGSTSVEKADGTFEILAVAPGECSLLAF